MKFVVTVQASAIVSAKIEVEANNKKEAEVAAEKQANMDAFDEIKWEIDSIEGIVDSVEVKEAK